MEPTPDIRIRVLGPVRVSGHDAAIAPKQRLLLGTLALSPGAVSTDSIVSLLWRDDPPEGARAAVHVHVSRLRRSIAATGAAIHRDGDGYTLSVDPAHVDLTCFEDLVARGSAVVATEPTRARELLRTALGLWRGPPLGDVAVDAPQQAAVVRLCDTRLHALEKRIEADLATGHHVEAIAELRQLVREHPLHEGFVGLLMRALYRAGRPGEALAAFEHARTTLADELGADPSRELRELHQQVLRQDASVGLPPSSASAEVQPDPASVAVLPFGVIGIDPDAALLAAGLHIDVLTELSRVPRLTVISRHSAQRYADSTVPPARIADELGVASIVTGSVQASGGRFRLTVQLLEAAAGVHRWVESYDRRITPQDLLAVQTQLARDIAESLSRQLVPGAGGARETSSMETYRWIAEGRMQFDRKTEDGLAQAVALFERVVNEDPGSAAGWVGLGQALAMTADYGYGDRVALVAAAESAVARAREIHPVDADLDVCLGLIAEGLQDAPTALEKYLSALSLQPGHADAASWHAWVSLTVGDAETGLASARLSVRHNPLSAEAVTNLALALLAVGRPEQALAETRRAAVLSPGYTTAAYYEGLALYDLGRFDEAVAALAPLSVVQWGEPSTPWAALGPDAALALAEIRTGHRDRARRTLTSIDPKAHPFEAGLVHAGLDDPDTAFSLFAACERVGYGPAMILHHHFRDIWASLGPDQRLDDLAAMVDRSWNLHRH